MKTFCLCTLFILSAARECAANGQDSLLKTLNKGEVTISERPLLFSDFTTMEVADTTWYFVGDNIENIQIAYCQARAENYAVDMIQVNKRHFRLFSNAKDDGIFDMDMKSAKLYHLSSRGRKFVCITGRNTISSGESSKIHSFVLLDITDPNKLKVGQLLSYSPSIYSFGDFNSDGELDFIKVKPGSRGDEPYIGVVCDLDGGPILLKRGKPFTIPMPGIGN